MKRSDFQYITGAGVLTYLEQRERVALACYLLDESVVYVDFPANRALQLTPDVRLAGLTQDDVEAWSTGGRYPVMLLWPDGKQAPAEFFYRDDGLGDVSGVLATEPTLAAVAVALAEQVQTLSAQLRGMVERWLVAAGIAYSEPCQTPAHTVDGSLRVRWCLYYSATLIVLADGSAEVECGPPLEVHTGATPVEALRKWAAAHPADASRR